MAFSFLAAATGVDLATFSGGGAVDASLSTTAISLMFFDKVETPGLDASATEEATGLACSMGEAVRLPGLFSLFSEVERIGAVEEVVNASTGLRGGATDSSIFCF